MIYVWFARHRTTVNEIRLQRKSNEKHNMHTQAAVPLPQSQFLPPTNQPTPTRLLQCINCCQPPVLAVLQCI